MMIAEANLHTFLSCVWIDCVLTNYSSVFSHYNFYGYFCVNPDDYIGLHFVISNDSVDKDTHVF